MKQHTVRDVMTATVITAGPNTAFKDIVELLTHNTISAVPVVADDGRVLGVVSEADLLAKEAEHDSAGHRPLTASPSRRHSLAKANASRAQDLMTSPAITVTADTSMVEAARLLHRRGVKRLPVVDDHHRLVGIVSRRDLLGMFLRTDHDLAEDIRTTVLDEALCAEPHTVSVDVTDGVAVLRGQVERSSLIPIAVTLTHQVEGVVDVIEHLTYGMDDTRLPKPDPTNVGVLHDLWPGHH